MIGSIRLRVKRRTANARMETVRAGPASPDGMRSSRRGTNRSGTLPAPFVLRQPLLPSRLRPAEPDLPDAAG